VPIFTKVDHVPPCDTVETSKGKLANVNLAQSQQLSHRTHLERPSNQMRWSIRSVRRKGNTANREGGYFTPDLTKHIPGELLGSHGP
jgi:hypothetical protein